MPATLRSPTLPGAAPPIAFYSLSLRWSRAQVWQPPWTSWKAGGPNASPPHANEATTQIANTEQFARDRHLHHKKNESKQFVKLAASTYQCYLCLVLIHAYPVSLIPYSQGHGLEDMQAQENTILTLICKFWGGSCLQRALDCSNLRQSHRTAKISSCSCELCPYPSASYV